MKVAITGTNGFIAYHLINSLKQINNIEIILIKRDELYDEKKLVSKIDKCEFLIHLAGVNRLEVEKDIYQENLKITNSIISALNKCENPPSILFSSSTREGSLDSYGRSKLDSRLKLESWGQKKILKF